MSNEELATRAKAGDHDALTQLWEQNRGLLAILFRKLARKTEDRMAAMGVTWEDVEQCGYLAIADAVTLYDPEAGALFSSFLRYPVMTQFFELIGWRTEKQKRDPLGQSLSLDEPITGEDGGTRADLVPDAQAFESIEERLYTEQLHAALEQCLDTLEQKQAEAVRFRYYSGLSLAETGAKLGCNTEYARQLEQKGLRKLRHPQNARRLEQYREQIITTHAYHGTGFSAWKYGGSVEERIIERLEL